MKSHGVQINRWLRRTLTTLPQLHRQKRRTRRGQTLILAISILFLMMLLGGIFVTMVVQNVQRAGRQSETDDALTLALAGIQYAAQQFRSSEQGADWRPKPTEVLWRTPTPPPGLGPIPLNPPHPIFGRELDADELRQIDPDQEWLSDSGRYLQPYVRISTGRGRFLLRVTFLPSYQSASIDSDQRNRKDEIDPNSGMIHIESIGRPGEFNPNDPTFFTLDTSETTSGVEVGTFRKVEAFIPMGMLSQLRWITNFTNERGPATLGVPSFVSGDGRSETFPTVFQGGIRSDVDLQFQGRNVIRLYPARGDQLVVKGNILLSTRSQGLTRQETDEPPLRVEPLSDAGDGNTKPAFPPATPPVIPPDQLDDIPSDDSVLISIPIFRESGTPEFQNAVNSGVLLTQGGDRRQVIRDSQQLRSTGGNTAQSAGLQPPPSLNQIDPTTGVDRYLRLTRDSGSPIEVQDTDGTGTRVVNSGAYGLTDIDLGAVRAKGLYLDNWDDIQIPTDRRRIKQIWMNPRAPEAQKYGWSEDYNTYLPKVDAGGVNHPITEVLLTRVQYVDRQGTTRVKPVIRVTRYDKDVREMNLAPESGRSYDRKFYNLNVSTLTAMGGRGTLTLVGQTRDFDWPENGIFLAEGSLRIRGMAGLPVPGGNPDAIDLELTRAKPLTIISRGSIYIEGNLQRENPGWQLGLFAHDFVCLNPTMIQRLRPSADVGAPVPDVPGDATKGFHYLINQGSFMDFTLAAATSLGSGLLHIKHAGQAGDTPLTAMVLDLPVLSNTPTVWPQWLTGNNTREDRYDFGGNEPPIAPPLPDPPYTGAGALYYLFRDLSPGDPNNWNESDHRSAEGAPDPERKTFYLPSLVSSGGPLRAGMETTFRLEVPPTASIPELSAVPPNGNDQPYWLSRLAITPADQPLPIRVEAVIYAFTGSWFVIPPPYFNDDDSADTRSNMNRNGIRASNTLPLNLSNDPEQVAAAQQYPFYNEPLNINIQVIGSITENMPAEPSEVAEWTRRLWTGNLDVDSDSRRDNNADNDPSHWPVEDPDSPAGHGNNDGWVARGRSLFSPRLSYRYDYTLQRMVRVRFVSTGKEMVVWSAPDSKFRPNSIPLLSAVVANARANLNTYVETLPVLPRLPAGSMIYEGNPLQ